MAARLGLEVVRAYSFPLPRRLGRLFAHNEFVVVASYESRPREQG
jgi:hypothetical protein